MASRTAVTTGNKATFSVATKVWSFQYGRTYLVPLALLGSRYWAGGNRRATRETVLKFGHFGRHETAMSRASDGHTSDSKPDDCTRPRYVAYGSSQRGERTAGPHIGRSPLQRSSDGCSLSLGDVALAPEIGHAVILAVDHLVGLHSHGGCRWRNGARVLA
eukprot:488864-Prymnesium_polylepis.1